MVVVPNPPPILALIMAVITSQLSTGIVYGWPALLPILEQEGVYADLCTDGVRLIIKSKSNA
jgi:hypothetical protein